MLDFVTKLMDGIAKFSVSLVMTLFVSIFVLVKLGVSYVVAVALGFPIGILLYGILLGLTAISKIAFDVTMKKAQNIIDNWDTIAKKKLYVFAVSFFVVAFAITLAMAYAVTKLV